MQRAEEMPPGHVLARDGKTTEDTSVIAEEACAIVEDTSKDSKDDTVCVLTPNLGSTSHYSDKTMGQGQREYAIEKLDSGRSSPNNQEGLDYQHPICLDSDDEPEFAHNIVRQQPELNDLVTGKSDQVKRPDKRRRFM